MQQSHWSIWLVLGLLLASCSAITDTTQPLLPFTMNSPEEVTRSFLDAWNTADTSAMYNALAARSRELTPLEQFQNRYTVVSDTIGLTGISYIIHDTLQQGTTAAVTYDVTMDSSVFGTIDDPSRTLYLVQEDNAWRVAWSTMDILDGMAEDVRLSVQSTLPRRASIYDRNGVPLVEQDRPIQWIAVVKQDMPNEEDCVQLLARLLLRPVAQLRTYFGGFNVDTLFHVGELDVDVFNANAESLNTLCALNTGSFKTDTYVSRHYVGQGALTHVTGYIGNIPAEQVAAYQARGYAESDLVGLSGIEAALQDTLAGRASRVLRLIEPGGTLIRELGGSDGAAPAPVQLTVERGLQLVTAQAMNEAFNYAEINWASVASGAAAVVIDVKSGQILALHSYPTFDPSLFNRNNSYSDPLALITQLNTDRRLPLGNKAVAEQYAPGSIYKLMTAVAVTDEGIWRPDEVFDCTLEWRGQQQFGDSLPFRQDWRVADEMPAAGPVTTMQAIATSCNPFFWQTGALLYQQDANALVRYSEQFGLGRRVSLNLLGAEAAGNVAPPDNPTSAINNAIGQGNIQVNPLQFALSVAAIANRGTLYAPMLVQQIGGFDGTPVTQTNTPEIRQTITLSDTVWNTIHDGMCLAVTDQTLGTARYAFEGAGYSVCGKTGTAETGPRGSNSPPHGWFVSFSPADDPQIATLVVVMNGREGSETAAPITRRILDYYYNQTPAPFPDWWEGTYVPVAQPEGVSG